MFADFEGSTGAESRRGRDTRGSGSDDELLREAVKLYEGWMFKHTRSPNQVVRMSTERCALQLPQCGNEIGESFPFTQRS